MFGNCGFFLVVDLRVTDLNLTEINTLNVTGKVLFVN